MALHIEYNLETDGRWIAEVLELPGVMSYGETKEQAAHRVKALASRVIEDRRAHGEAALVNSALKSQG